MKVIGLIVAKNEWPLLALSISHALMHHVDEVYFLNHSCTDGTNEGIKKLQEIWKDRLHVIKVHIDNFWQESFTYALLEISQSSLPDWIYIFDADEFLLTEGNYPLKKILEAVDPKYSVIRYSVENWISTRDFDESIVDCYRMLRYRSLPNDYKMNDADKLSGVIQGSSNFFDFPFPSKIIFKNNEKNLVFIGTHFLKYPTNIEELCIDNNKLRVAHLPYYCKKRLFLKADHGFQCFRNSDTKTFGWQNQAIYSLFEKELLDQFWEVHSISLLQQNTNDRKLPTVIIDESFINSIEPVLSFIENKYGALHIRNDNEANIDLTEDSVTLSTFINLTRKLQLIIDETRQEKDSFWLLVKQIFSRAFHSIPLNTNNKTALKKTIKTLFQNLVSDK